MEELKLILETVTALGTEAKWAFFVWLTYKTLTFLVAVAAALGGVWMVARILFSGGLPERLRDEMGIGSPGYVLPSEAREMFKWIRDRRDLPKKPQ